MQPQACCCMLLRTQLHTGNTVHDDVLVTQYRIHMH